MVNPLSPCKLDCSIRAVVSEDVLNWDVAHILVIRGGLPNKDFGCPPTRPHPDDRLLHLLQRSGA